MLPIKKLSDAVSVAGWLNPADFASVKALGFDTVVNFRPDNEARGQISSEEAEAAAKAAGLAYVHIPVTKHDLFTDAVVGAGGEAFAGPGRVLGYCASGQRAAIVWAAATARSHPANEVLASLHDAGFDLGVIRDDLEAQADRARWSEPAKAPLAAAE
jgi:sulfide:quinone oxidoreductase